MGGTLQALLASSKGLLGNVQIISAIKDSFALQWPQELLDFARSIKMLALDISAYLDLRCTLGSWDYTFESRLKQRQ